MLHKSSLWEPRLSVLDWQEDNGLPFQNQKLSGLIWNRDLMAALNIRSCYIEVIESGERDQFTFVVQALRKIETFRQWVVASLGNLEIIFLL
jgi:hypothetical protein